MKKMSISLIIFLMFSCQSKPTFRPSFEYLDSANGEMKACLGKKDLIDLKKVLLNCEAK